MKAPRSLFCHDDRNDGQAERTADSTPRRRSGHSRQPAPQTAAPPAAADKPTCIGSSDRLIPTHVVASAASWCASYRHPTGWRSIYSPHAICATCHPPAVPSIVAELLQRDPAVDEPPPFPWGAGPDVPRPHALLSHFAAEARRDKAEKQLRQQRREAQR